MLLVGFTIEITVRVHPLKTERMNAVFYMLFPASKTASLKTKFQAYYRIRRLITVSTKADYWSLY